MRAAGDVDDYRADPVGAYLALPRALVFCARRSLWGFSLWGTPTEAELRTLMRAMDEALARAGAERRTVLEDLAWAILTSTEFLFNH